MTNPSNPEQKPGMSTGKKWLIGCGGCLGVVLIALVACSLLAGLGMNALKNASSNSISEIFGKEFKPEPYMAFGLPLGQKNMKNMVFLIDQKRGTTLFAIDTELSPADGMAIKNGDATQIQDFLKHMSEEATSRSSSSSSAHLRDVQFESTETVTLPNGKRFPISKATVETDRRGTTAYSPAVAVLIPEADNRLIALIAMAPNSSSAEANTDFSSAQTVLQTEMVRIVSDSALDDRLISTKAIQASTTTETP